MESVCARIDHALEERDLDLLKPALRDFNPAFDRLQLAALGKKENHKDTKDTKRE